MIDKNDWRLLLSEALKLARAAIAKAEGQE